MKKILLLFIWTLAVLPLMSQSVSFTGTWYSNDNDSLIFEFSPEGYVSMTDFDSPDPIVDEEPHIVGGANFVYKDGDKKILTDLKYKYFPSKPDHLYFVLYKAATDTPYLIVPILMDMIDYNTIEIIMLEADADNAHDDGILYEGEKDWALAAKTIEEAKKPGSKIKKQGAFVLKRVK